MPVTYLSAASASPRWSACPPLAGFFSKESVLGVAEEAALHDGPLPAWSAWLVLLAGLVTVLLTAAYATRPGCWPSSGHRRGRSHRDTIRRPRCARPLIVLAVPTVVLGVLAFTTLRRLGHARSGRTGRRRTRGRLVAPAGRPSSHWPWSAVARARRRSPNGGALGPARPGRRPRPGPAGARRRVRRRPALRPLVVRPVSLGSPTASSRPTGTSSTRTSAVPGDRRSGARRRAPMPLRRVMSRAMSPPCWHSCVVLAAAGAGAALL